MKHKSVATDFRRSLMFYLEDPHYVKIPDAPIFKGMQKRPIYKPYDAYMLWEGKFFAFEYKTWNQERFPLSAVRPHQPTALLDVKRNGGYAFFVFCNSLEKNDIYLIDIDDWIAFIQKLEHKSISKRSLTVCNYQVYHRTKTLVGYGWDLSDFLVRYGETD